MNAAITLLRLAIVLCLILSGALSVAMAAPSRAGAYGFDNADLCGADPASETGGLAGHDCLACALYGTAVILPGPSLQPLVLRPAPLPAVSHQTAAARAQPCHPGWQGHAPPLT